MSQTNADLCISPRARLEAGMQMQAAQNYLRDAAALLGTLLDNPCVNQDRARDAVQAALDACEQASAEALSVALEGAQEAMERK